MIRAVQHHCARSRRVDHRLIVRACLAPVVLAYRDSVHVIQFVQHLVVLLAPSGVAQSRCPPIAKVCLITIEQTALVPASDTESVMIGYRRILLATVPVTVQSVEAAMKRIEEAVARSVV